MLHNNFGTDEGGRFLWQGWKFRTTTAELKALWAKIPDDVTVVELWAGGGLDFDELADDIAIEICFLKLFDAEIVALDDRIEALYEPRPTKSTPPSLPATGSTPPADQPAETPPPPRN